MLSPNELAVNQIRSISRRNLIKMSGGCAALTSTSLLGQLLNLQLTKAAVAAEGGTDGYKALVCLFFFGGIDSYTRSIRKRPMVCSLRRITICLNRLFRTAGAVPLTVPRPSIRRYLASNCRLRFPIRDWVINSNQTRSPQRRRTGSGRGPRC